MIDLRNCRKYRKYLLEIALSKYGMSFTVWLNGKIKGLGSSVKQAKVVHDRPVVDASTV